MKMLKKYGSILMMLTLLVGFTSCDDDEDLFDQIVGRKWVGYLGFQDRLEDLESGVYFGSDGFGSDELDYYDGERFGTLNMQWWIERGTIVISYGNRASLRELRNIYVRRGRLEADLYVEGQFIDRIELIMQ